MSRNNHHPNATAGTMNSKSKPKKFCTRGEEFFDFLVALGYQPSKHQEPEHFEYLFQDEMSAAFVRKLMSTLKTDNCLLPEDICRYENLKKQDLVLYGRNLEEAIARRRAICEMFDQQMQKKLAKKLELKKLVEQDEVELERLEKLRDGVFLKEVEDWQARRDKMVCFLEVIQRLIVDYEKEIGIDLMVLSARMEELEKTVLHLKTGRNEGGHHYLCQIDVAGLMEREENLLKSVQEMVSKHGAELILKDAGYAVEGDPLNEENIKKIFCQYEKDFNRLKHCIVYEKVNQLALTLSLAGPQGSMENFVELWTKARHLAVLDYDTRAKLQMETRDSINDLTTAFERESSQLTYRIREITSAAVNQQFSAIINIKSRAKKKLHEFFKMTTEILKAQKIRVSLIRSLIKSEGKMYNRLVSNIEKNIAASTAQSKKLASQTTIVTGLTEEGRILEYFMSLLGINNPGEVITSLPNVHLIINKGLNELENCYWATIEEARSQVQSFKKDFWKTHDVLKNLSFTNNLPEDGVAAKVQEKEAYLKQQTEVLKNLQLTRAGFTKEQQKQRVQSNQKLLDCLANDKNFE